MINLFSVNKPIINTSLFSNLLYDDIVHELEEKIADYVGAKYAVATNSATSAIFLSLKCMGNKNKKPCSVPSIITTRFLHAIEMAGYNIEYEDDVDWVGGNYCLYKEVYSYVFDSAQMIDPGQFLKRYSSKDLCIFSFYPTKPIGGIQGGMIVSDNKEKIDWIRKATYFGEEISPKSWKSAPKFKGYQMFMNAIEAYAALRSFEKYPEKRYKLNEVREKYKDAFGDNVVTGDSFHLFRIKTSDAYRFIDDMSKEDIVCGHHYKAAHLNEVWGNKKYRLPKSEQHGQTVVSIPFHEHLTKYDVYEVIKYSKQYM